MYTTDCVNQIVCFIYDDYIAVKPYSTGFSGGLVEKDVIGQNDKLVEDKIGKKLDFLIMKRMVLYSKQLLVFHQYKLFSTANSGKRPYQLRTNAP